MQESDYDNYEDEEEFDSDSCDEEVGRPALAMDSTQLTPGDGPPQNGHDYLRFVIAERKSIPAISSAPPPPSDQVNCQANNAEETSSSSDMELAQSNKVIANESINNSESAQQQTDDIDCREEILENFRSLRERMDEIRESNTSIGDLGVSTPVLDSSMVDEKVPCEKELQRQVNRSTLEANSLLKLMELGQPPQVSSLISKSQLTLHMTLDLLADHCAMQNHQSTIHTDWIYSLMAALREPIEPDICSTLRRLARICISKRRAFEAKREAESPRETSVSPSQSRLAKKNKRKASAEKAAQSQNNEDLVRALEEEEYLSSLLVICIVRHHFGQTDLK